MDINCIVDIASREVSFQENYRIAAYDHNVDVIRFSIEPIEDFSLDTSTIKIAAQGPNKARHDYAVDPSTVQIEEETGYIAFDWPIPAGVTEMPIGTFKYGDKGNLIFAVCAEIISGDTVSKAWHSDDGIITVVAHLEPESGGGEDPEEEATNAQKIGQLQTDVAVINTQVSALGNGSPTPVATVAEMTDESAVYLYTGSETGYTAGNWYYYNGTAWTSGGVYGGAVTSTTFNQHGVPADDFAVGEALAEKADEIGELNERLEGVSDSVKSLIGKKENPATNWEIGNISTNATSGYTYNSSGRRLRTKEGISYHLKQGNTVTIKNEVELTKTDQTKETVQLQFWVSWYNATLSKYEWRNYDSSEFTVPIESDYVFVIHVTGEPNFLTIYTDAISVISSALSIFGDSITTKMEHDFEMSNFDSDGATKFICRMGWDIYNSTTPPQGSVASFKEAYKHGFRIMLADIFATADNKLVIAHDDNISLIGAKNSDGTAISGTVNITESTLAQLDAYDFGIYKGSDYAGYKIPRLEDFLRFCKKYNCKIIFEMKDRSLSDEELQSFVSMINKYGLMDSITSVGYIRATDSERFGLLFPKTPLWYDIGTLTEANINYVYNNRPSTGNFQWIYMLVNNSHPISDAVTQLTEFGEYVKSKGMGLGITELSTASELTALETGEVLSMLDYIAIKDLSTYVNFLYD